MPKKTWKTNWVNKIPEKIKKEKPPFQRKVNNTK